MQNVVLIAYPDSEKLESFADLLDGAGFHPLIARNGSDALATAAAYMPQVAILAAELADIQGTDVCLRLKQERATKGIAVILLASNPSVEETFVMERVRPDQVLTEPVEGAQLVQCVQELLASHSI